MSRAPPQPDLFAGLDAEEPQLPRVRARLDQGGDGAGADPPQLDEIGNGALRSGHGSSNEDATTAAHQVEARPRSISPSPSKKSRAQRTGSTKSASAKVPAKAVSARTTITLPKGPVLAAIKREAAKEGLSVTQAAFRALARGARRADLDVEDRLNRLEASLAAHRKATARDFALTQELVAALAQLVCERLPVRDLPAMLKAAATRDVEALLRRVVEAAGRG
jgi:hypothetical protein